MNISYGCSRLTPHASHLTTHEQIMEKDLVKRANKAFNQGDFLSAKSLYETAAERYGKSLFNLNIALCEKCLKIRSSGEPVSLTALSESEDVKRLEEKIVVLKNQLRDKDVYINERFKELAILTRILEEKS